MTTVELICQKAKELPEIEAREVLDFVEFLKVKRMCIIEKRQRRMETDESDQLELLYNRNFDPDAWYV